MARFLNEREVGMDQDRVGFPNIGDCMGVVLRTPTELYGFHAMPGDTARVTAFATFITATKIGSAVHLYGSCIRQKRHGGVFAQWKQEMIDIATGLNYHGPASGFDMPEYPKKKDGTMDTTYIEYRRSPLGNTCSIWYKRMSKMDVATGGNFTTDPVGRVTPQRGGGFVVAPPTISIVTDASVIATYWNKGEMHEAPDDQVDTFTIP